MKLLEIYKATNTVTGKSYIGFTNDFSVRKSNHFGDASRGSTTHFHNSIRKHGKDNFKWVIIAEATTRKEAGELETKLIHKHDTFVNGYNSTTGGESDWEITEKMRANIVAAAKNRPPVSSKTRKKLSELHTGKIVSIKARKNMSIAHLGYKPSKESIQKRADSNRGKKRTQEMRDKMSIAAKKLPIVICPHCEYEGRGNSMARWHLDKCRNKRCD